ncbi:hypothetical protein DSO57_1019231 [Entomophthora muscae]|uniref:Uncharacterized protein n=1 Tax=Entomophthora muscae TaxID=34485 RepID=A0ACC2TF63_9FUNG|nr:hypothetical protein DSO57_1019231 [Entomophthora muscae]
MTPPPTPPPKHRQGSGAANKFTSTQMFGVRYIAHTGLIDAVVSASKPWVFLGKLLAPTLWGPFLLGLWCKVLWPIFGPELGCISPTIKKGGPGAGKTPLKPGGLGPHGRQTLCVGLPG